MKSEFELIERLKKKIPKHLQGNIPIGDDAGALNASGNFEWLVTTDTVVDGVDFVVGKIHPQMAGRKALAINLSDIAAMGGEATAFVVALGIPRGFKENWIEKFYQGMIKLAWRHKVACLGGDITRSRDFFASITLIGQARKNEIILRSGAKKGNLIAVTGKLGGSILGKHFCFEPRIKEARFLAQNFHPTSMMDISDGLCQDLGHILKASGVGATLDLEQIPIAEAARKISAGNSRKSLEHALTDGEDFELLFTISAAKRKRLEKSWKQHFPGLPLSWIGKISSRKGKISWSRGSKTIPSPDLKRKGFTHF